MTRNGKTLRFASVTYGDALTYCFPGREFVLSKEPRTIHCPRGFLWPFPFVTVLLGDRGVTLIADAAQALTLQKDERDLAITFEGTETVESVPHDGHFWSGICAYRAHLVAVYGAPQPMPAYAAACFHVRRYFFHKRFCRQAILENGGVHLRDIYDADCHAVGGIDAGLLFDYAYDVATDLRCGNDAPWHDDPALRPSLCAEIHALAQEGCTFFAYFDPWLIQDGSAWDRTLRGAAEVRDKNQEILRIWDLHQWHPCISYAAWRTTSLQYLKHVADLLPVSGLYLDECGNGTQFPCQNALHHHPEGETQTEREISYLLFLKERLPFTHFLCEFAPDVRLAQHFDIVLSDTRTTVNIYRFILPHIRFVRIIHCDRPIGDDLMQVDLSFFNGEGIWLDNDLTDNAWISPRVRTAIRTQYAIQKAFVACFSSADCEALVTPQASRVLAHRFTDGKTSVYTFWNPLPRAISLPVLLPAGTQAELWYPARAPVVPSANGDTCITLAAASAGCLVVCGVHARDVRFGCTK